MALGADCMKKKQIYLLLLLNATFLLSACDPEVGTDQWCAQMQEKAKGDWSANEAGNFAQHCMFKYQK
jgi:hypothetical protein